MYHELNIVLSAVQKTLSFLIYSQVHLVNITFFPEAQ